MTQENNVFLYVFNLINFVNNVDDWTMNGEASVSDERQMTNSYIRSPSQQRGVGRVRGGRGRAPIHRYAGQVDRLHYSRQKSALKNVGELYIRIRAGDERIQFSLNQATLMFQMIFIIPVYKYNIRIRTCNPVMPHPHTRSKSLFEAEAHESSLSPKPEIRRGERRRCRETSCRSLSLRSSFDS